MTPDERAAALASKVSAFCTGGKTWSWTTNGVTFTVSGFAVIKNGVRFTVGAFDANGPLPTDNPYLFINPPTALRDPALHTAAAGTEILAARSMVESAVLLVARQRGWR